MDFDRYGSYAERAERANARARHAEHRVDLWTARGGFYISLIILVSAAYDAGRDPNPTNVVIDLCAMAGFGFVAYKAARRAQQKHLDI